jgi:tRNA A37 threonylcarbamoyladenosine synthetase subunit TsaC/SUA5/YrdC
MKKRSFDKPLAILIESFDRLFENTYLTEEQIDFLNNYENPFTILCECPAIKVLIHFDEGKHFYKNKDVYEKMAFRVAHTASQKKLLNKIGPMFLTSANYAGEPEIYTKA